MKINANLEIKNFEGEVIRNIDKPVTLGQIVSEILLQNKSGGKMKMFTLAQRFYSEESVTLDMADFGLVKKAIEDTDVYGSVLATGQILSYLESLKEEEK